LWEKSKGGSKGRKKKELGGMEKTAETQTGTGLYYRKEGSLQNKVEKKVSFLL